MVNAKIDDMTDSELIELVEICAAMFNTIRLSNVALTGYAKILRGKFPKMMSEKVLQLCTDVAANPPKPDIKFTPSFMAQILRSVEKDYRPILTMEKVASLTEKIKVREQFLKDLYEDFNNHKAGKRMVNIFAWQHVALQLESAGYVDRLPDIQPPKSNTGNLTDVFAGYRPFVVECFDRMIKDGKHVADYIHGLPTS